MQRPAYVVHPSLHLWSGGGQTLFYKLLQLLFSLCLPDTRENLLLLLLLLGLHLRILLMRDVACACVLLCVTRSGCDFLCVCVCVCGRVDTWPVSRPGP